MSAQMLSCLVLHANGIALRAHLVTGHDAEVRVAADLLAQVDLQMAAVRLSKGKVTMTAAYLGSRRVVLVELMRR